MTHGSLFSGIGGFDLAAEWMGWENVFHCEMNPFGQRVLAHHFPNSKLYEDVKTFPSSDYIGRIDILTGGFPCQPYSMAGKRLGKDDDRHLWPFMLDIIRTIQPRYVVGENVRGLVNWNDGMVFDEVQADLELAGYEVLPFVLPAAAVGAPHRRDRVWFIAHSNERHDGRTARKDASEGGEERVQQRDAVREPAESGEVQRFAAHAQNIRLAQTEGVGRERREHEPNNWNEVRYPLDADGGGRNAAHADGKRSQSEQTNRELEGRRFGQLGEPRKHWQDFPTQPPICSGDDGLPRELDGITFPKWRNESIKAYGNAIVPQVAYQIFQAIQQTDEIRTNQAHGAARQSLF